MLGDPAFNLRFDFVFRSMNDRLHRFDTADACGRWNSILIEDFRSDTRFVHIADELFSDAVAEYSNGECVTSDGLAIESVTIDFGRSMKLHFRLQFLDAPNGCWDAPAQFSLAPDPNRVDNKCATLSCGLHESDGNFWHPRKRRMSSVVLPDDYDWAYRRTRIYCPPTISAWIQMRRSGGEQ